MARLGLLMLNKGKWENKQIISEDWVNKISTTFTANKDMNPDYHQRGPFGYGIMWWVWDEKKATEAFQGAYIAQGYLGQFIVVLPKLDMVVALKTKASYGRGTSHKQFYNFLKLVVASYMR